MKNLYIKDIPEDLGIKIKATAALRNIKIKDLVIAALESYLQNNGRRSLVDVMRGNR